IQGWNWYTGSDPTGIGSNQYDFQTIATHELGHALGLGHSPDASSVMFPDLSAGVVKRALTAKDLTVPDTVGGGAHALHALLPQVAQPIRVVGDGHAAVGSMGPPAELPAGRIWVGSSTAGVLLGGDGQDVLIGGGGRNLLVGGFAADRLAVGSGDNGRNAEQL